jgi:glycosyltransferase involved in cell wall biosynthesis
LRQFPGDVLHLNLPSTYDGGVSSLAWAAKRAGYARVVTTEHLPMIERRYKKFPVKLLFTQWIDAVIAIAEANRPYLERRHGVDPEKIHAIANGVDPVPPLEAPQRATLRECWGARPGDLVLGVVARLTERKGHAVLFEALHRAEQGRTLPPWRLVLLGEGEAEPDLRARAGELGLSGRVCWGGAVQDAARQMQAFDLFVLPSKIETMPLTILEAMSGEVPVLATAIFGVPELIEHGVSGWLVPPADARALGEALARLSADPPLRAHLARAGAERFAARFTAAHMTERTMRLYLEQTVELPSCA